MGRKLRRATPYAAVGKRLKAVRLALDFDVLEDFAREIGIRSNYWSQHETGVRLITLDRARELKSRFGVGLDFIFDGNLDDLPKEFESRFNEHFAKL